MYGVALTNPSWAGNLLHQQFDDLTFAIDGDVETVYLNITVSGVDAGPYSDAAEILVDLQASGTDAGPYHDTDTVLVDIQVSGTDVFTPLAPYTPVLDDFNRADGGLGANWSSWYSFAAGDIVGNLVQVDTSGFGAYWNPTTFGDYQDVFVDASTTNMTVILGAMIQSNAGLDGYLAFTTPPTGTEYEYIVLVDGVTPIMNDVFDLGALVTKWWLRVGGGVVSFYAYANGIWNPVESVADATYTTGNIAIAADISSGTGSMDNFGGGGSQETADLETIYLDLQGSGSEEMHGTLIDAATVPLVISGSAFEESPYNDAAVVPLLMDVSTSFETFGKQDDAVVYLDLQPSGFETPSWDIATIYVLMTPLGGECFSRFHWTCEGEAEPRWGTDSDLPRWQDESVLPRWYCTIEVQPGCN